MREPTSGRSRWRWWAAALVLVLGLVVVIPSSACRGHMMRQPFVPNHPGDFDFASPPCQAGPRPDPGPDRVLMRYLGTSGLYLQWRGTALLFGPFFSNPPPLRVALGSLRWDDVAIDRGMADLLPAPIVAVLVGHSHYDHLGDVPPVIARYAPEALLLVNRSGRNMVAGCRQIDEQRVIVLEERSGSWIDLSVEGAPPAPFRILPIVADHAPANGAFRFAPGEVEQRWDCIDGRRPAAMRQGQPFAFLVDLLDERGRTAFRLLYHDAPTTAPKGVPPAEVLDQRAVDVAMLCMPTSWLVEGYPQRVLEATRAHHVLVTHYEDFFRDPTRPIRFVPTLTDRRAREFMERARDGLTRGGSEPRGPQAGLCGPAGPSWTMPLPGEWLRFDVDVDRTAVP